MLLTFDIHLLPHRRAFTGARSSPIRGRRRIGFSDRFRPLAETTETPAERRNGSTGRAQARC